MILTCPACGTQYVVKDGAIPPAGRQVRCAACKHSWHQDPQAAEPEPDAGPGTTEPAEAPPPFPPAEDGAAPAPSDERVSAETSEWTTPTGEQAASEREDEREYAIPAAEYDQEEADSIEAAPAAADVDQGAAAPVPTWQPPETDIEENFSPFAYEDEPEPKRRWPALLIGLLAIAALAAAFWFLAPPQWKQSLGLTASNETPLQLMMTHSDRQKLASGNELLAVSGRVINPTDERQDVPPIQAQLRSSKGELVYSWTIAPPARSLPPRASATFNSAEVNVPAGGDELTITLGNPRA
jgi:predicted Zn finger-like uncharacterized protein